MGSEAPLIIGRYALYDKIAAGGMATVFIGRLLGPVGFARTVAIKRLHPQFASDTDFVSMFLDEARLAARIHHPNVVSTLDVVATMGELFLVMDYVRGESVSALVRSSTALQQRIPDRVAAAILSGALQGLHAAHVATDESGHALGIVHRDMSPQNVLVGIDGTSRVLDFGVAKAANRIHTTRGGEVKGKISYMPPEQLEGHAVDCRADIYSAGLVLFEVVTGQRMFRTAEEIASIAAILRNAIVMPSSVDPALAPWDAVVRRATLRDPEQRYPNARAMALDVERVAGAASTVEVADFVERMAGQSLKDRTKRIAEIESSSGVSVDFGQAALVKELGHSSVPALDEILVEHEPLDPAPASAMSHAVSIRRAIALGQRRWPVALGACALIAAAALAAASAMREHRAPPSAAQEPSPAESVASVPSPPAPPTATPPPTPAAEPPPPAPPAAADPTAVAQDPPSPVRTAGPAAGARPRPGPAPQAKPTTKPNCERPTTVDSAGHVHFRPECL